MPKEQPHLVKHSENADLRESAATVSEGPTSLSALKEQAAGLRRAQVMANLAHVVTKPDGSFETWSETLPKLIGVPPNEVVTSTRRWLDLIHPEDRARFRSVALEARAKKSRAEVEYRLWRKDGTWVHVRQVMEPIPGKPDAQGRRRWFNTLQDVTELVRAQYGARRLNRVYAVLSGINGAIARIRERQQLFQEACRIAIEEGQFVMAWVGLVDKKASIVDPVASAGNVGAFFEAAPMAILETKPGGHGLAGRVVRTKAPVISNDVKNDPQRLMRKELDERGINSLAILPLIVEDNVVGTLALYATDPGFFDEQEMRLLTELAHDVSFALDRIEKARKLDYVSYYDSLTGLPNRPLFHERLRVQLADAEAKKTRVAVMVLDIERFKTINDTLGRQAGDGLLAEVAKRLKQGGHPASWHARLGGDHFAIVVPAITTDEALTKRNERRLRQIFGSPFAVLDHQLRVSARLGIALYPQDGQDSDTLLHNAEAALKTAKASGERSLFYTPDMTARSPEKFSLENKLREALERNQFVLHYQPKVDLRTRSIVGLEALIRWQHPELGLAPPAKFIPLLEETGLILDVGAWALKHAAMDHRNWSDSGLKPPKIAVNISAIQIRQRDFVKTVEQAIAEAPGAIDLEITESIVMEDVLSSIKRLNELRRLGVSVAIDDFGTGYSSLAYLARLPVETLKIDRSFVKAMDDDPTARTLVQTIISLAHSLRLLVVAEGVETERQAELLRELQCDQMQGYLFSKPLPSEALAKLLQAKI
jgi:diguanylate cyclase (GGDEF)-like protein/PAS domain S-box-containing protein